MPMPLPMDDKTLPLQLDDGRDKIKAFMKELLFKKFSEVAAVLSDKTAADYTPEKPHLDNECKKVPIPMEPKDFERETPDTVGFVAGLRVDTGFMYDADAVMIGHMKHEEKVEAVAGEARKTAEKKAVMHEESIKKLKVEIEEDSKKIEVHDRKLEDEVANNFNAAAKPEEVKRDQRLLDLCKRKEAKVIEFKGAFLKVATEKREHLKNEAVVAANGIKTEVEQYYSPDRTSFDKPEEYDRAVDEKREHTKAKFINTEKKEIDDLQTKYKSEMAGWGAAEADGIEKEFTTNVEKVEPPPPHSSRLISFITPNIRLICCHDS